MRFHGIALLTSAAILGACGGEKTPAASRAAGEVTSVSHSGGGPVKKLAVSGER